ncbi:DoxX family protein [Paenibacillus alginolyticus]|uniref:DoxX family protein n=1 Tax=Paenibacillus alginolyticus TaxID=59839 RepID=A0ABT4GAH1_9BACL|nr:DoxX family protein [Paenibacillus alginolyticus]MCY9693187.1 DoxX family protein [Paenibacillus alginolyticus]MEC0144518.1 DoxX family protein [Paenibacillus alginolyticus]
MLDAGLLIIRAVIGLLMIGHAGKKLFGLFGGGGVKGTAGFMESIGLKPGVFMAVSAGLLEGSGGLLFAAGLWTWVGALCLMISMLVAIAKFHGANGIWGENNGYEYNLVMIAVLLGVAFTGAGALSIDAFLN